MKYSLTHLLHIRVHLKSTTRESRQIQFKFHDQYNALNICPLFQLLPNLTFHPLLHPAQYVPLCFRLISFVQLDPFFLFFLSLFFQVQKNFKLSFSLFSLAFQPGSTSAILNFMFHAQQYSSSRNIKNSYVHTTICFLYHYNVPIFGWTGMILTLNLSCIGCITQITISDDQYDQEERLNHI